MDVLLKKTTMKRRASLSLLFGSQRPTFATPNDKPTRYYDFVDSPTPFRIESHLISRQEIPPELELEIKNACSSLAHQIEQGVPSAHNNQDCRGVTQDGLEENFTAKNQLISKYSSFKVGPITGYDSGVGLTQQPSMQTMRVLHSRSGDASESGDTRAVSVFCNTRTGTSCSNISAVNSLEPSCTQSSSQSPRPSELQSIAGANISGCAEKNHATRAFLTEISPSPSEPPPCKEESIPAEDTKVFLNPTDPSPITNLSSSTLSSHPSPRLGLSRVPGLNQQPLTSNPNLEYKPKPPKSRGIIIDSTGHARLLTPDEESQRNKELQQAVLAKMTPGLISYSPIHEPSRQQSSRQSTAVNNISSSAAHQSPDSQSRRLPASTSRFGLSWSGFKSDLDGLRRKGQNKDQNSRSRLRDEVPLLGKLSSLFSRERSSESVGGRK